MTWQEEEENHHEVICRVRKVGVHSTAEVHQRVKHVRQSHARNRVRRCNAYVRHNTLYAVHIVRSKINIEVQVYAGIIGGSAPCVHLPYKVACVGLRFGFPRGGAQQYTRHCDAASSSASCGGDSTVMHISRRHEQLR